MGVYEKMKAAIYDLTETLDEAVSFKEYAYNVQPARKGLYLALASEGHGINSIAAQEAKKYGNESRFSIIKLS